MVGTPFLVFLVSALLIVCVFGGVAISTRQPRHVEYARAQRLRGLFFLSLAAILVVFLVLTLPRLPYPVEAATSPALSAWAEPMGRVAGSSTVRRR